MKHQIKSILFNEDGSIGTDVLVEFEYLEPIYDENCFDGSVEIISIKDFNENVIDLSDPLLKQSIEYIHEEITNNDQFVTNFNTYYENMMSDQY